MISWRQLFLNHMGQTSPAPMMLEIDRAKGIYLYDRNNESYMDLISGISVSNLGHCHPKVVEAVQNQASKYMHLMVYGEYVYYPAVKLAELLTKQLPNNLQSVYFVNSGSEATEGALKLAKRITGRTQIIGFKNAYHGSTHGALSVIGSEYYKMNYRPLLPDTLSLEFGNYSHLEKITQKTACIITEPLQSEAGIFIPDTAYLHALQKRCNETGTIFILDEIQTGFGRTGNLFRFQEIGITPDILLLAKGMGGGMPIGAFVSSKEHMDLFTDNPVLGHITTFGGHPVSCAAGLATLEVLLESDLIAQVNAKAALFNERLQHEQIQGRSNAGLLMAFRLKDYNTNMRFIQLALERKMIIDWFLFADDCFRIAPPLIISEEEINKACDLILDALNGL